ncbi:MAG: OsmC family protein [Woeseiaceae bacterium]|nr:OsmC family protein [Woeseiaceae bacterium]
MQDLPHHYAVAAQTTGDGPVTLSSRGLDSLESAGPVEFGGPGDLWSPETLLVAAVADCFVLSFQATARAARFEWRNLRCDVEGTLERVDGETRFTKFVQRVVLELPVGADEARGRKLLAKAERSCLITNSLRGATELVLQVEFGNGA